MEDRILNLVHTAMNRRTLLKGTIGAAAAASIVGNFVLTETETLAANLPDDLAILNFALTLEHLEARAYKDAIASGVITGAALGPVQAYGRQEAEHVALLTGAISQAGGKPVAEQASYKFPAFTAQQGTLEFLRTLEDVGVGAYTGAARFIQSKAILTVAGGIVQVEARHAAIIRLLSGVAPVPGPLDKVLTPDQTLAAAGPILG